MEKKAILFEVSAKQFLTFTAFFIGLIVISAGIMTITVGKLENVENQKLMGNIELILLMVWILVLIWKTVVFLKLRNQLIKESNKEQL